MSPEELRVALADRFGHPGTVVARAPGRVNLIGEHTDYNDGFVLPMATQQCTWVAAARTAGPAPVVRAYSVNLADEQAWPVDEWRAGPRPQWTSYVAGVAALLRQRGLALGGFDVLVHSELGVGSGLSSSAALTVAVALAASALCGQELPIKDLAAVCRSAEHEFAGVPCGVMDQYASLACRAGAALLLDCRSLKYEQVPLVLGEHTVVAVDSGVRHELVAGEYARRQAQCAEALAYFRRLQPTIQALRDVDAAMVRAHAGQMDPLAAARARHVTSENARTLAAAAALRRRDLAEMGRLMLASHASLRDDYEVSCAELDQLIELVGALPGVLGARMTGGGFGGCIVALARRDALATIERTLRERYDSPQHVARLLAVEPGAGAALESS